MKAATAQVGNKQPDVPLLLALLASLGVAGLFLWLKTPHGTELAALKIKRFGEINSLPLETMGCLLLGNILLVGWVISQKIHELQTRAKLPPTARKVLKKARQLPSIRTVALFMAIALGSLAGAWYLTARHMALRRLEWFPISVSSSQWSAFFVLNLAIGALGIALAIRTAWGHLAHLLPAMKNHLPRLRVIRDGVVLGSIHEDEGLAASPGCGRAPEWRYQGLRGLTGNLFISGSIGSGKSQIVLRLLKQILANFSAVPTLLAIDPKRTFVRELRKIIEAQGMSERLLWVSLDGTVKFNPIWYEGMLRNSAFTSVANTLRLASMNFLGSSSDSRFWEQSSFNLLKNALVYCAAKHDYFTFHELYDTLVLARDSGLGAELADCLKEGTWDAEETDNILMAAKYFENEFSRMDEKIRTSILATATGFLNEFLEYRVSRILSPARVDITLSTVGQAVRDGKLICLYIENDSLARSIGTLFKLLYQEAVLERVNVAAAPGARYAVLVMDEYQDVATSGGGAGLGDDRYLAKARESKAITIAATQSVSSLENAIRSEPATREILQNFRTRIFGNSTDPKTIHLFQEPHGQVERERHSHGISESAQGTRPDLFGGYGSDRMSRSESVSTHYSQEFPVTAREFSRLRPFESFAQVFDGVETHFEKLFLKPYFLKDMRTPHARILSQLRKAAEVARVKRPIFGTVLFLILSLAGRAQADVLFPNVCSVVRSSEFTSCVGFNVGVCMCGWPVPRPCAQISYYVPQTFIEVWPESKDTFFGQHPAGAHLALRHLGSSKPFGADDEEGSFSFQAHAIAVPLAGEVFDVLPCQGGRVSKPCFDLMSEDLGSHWSDGHGDQWQPQYLAWQLSPKACLLKGAAAGAIGVNVPSVGVDSGGCSYPQVLPKFPPSPREACNGWGLFFPRSGIYQGADRTAAALMIAARLKSLGGEVSFTVPGDPDELWQMLYPQGSSCFKEGQNLGWLETIKGVREEQRLFGKPNGYLFVVWKKVSCCHDIAEAPAAAIEIEALRAACAAIPGGGV